MNPDDLMALMISCFEVLKLTPVEATTFSSIIVEPKSFAPNRKATWASFSPWVTHEACMFVDIVKIYPR